MLLPSRSVVRAGKADSGLSMMEAARRDNVALLNSARGMNESHAVALKEYVRKRLGAKRG